MSWAGVVQAHAVADRRSGVDTVRGVDGDARPGRCAGAVGLTVVILVIVPALLRTQRHVAGMLIVWARCPFVIRSEVLTVNDGVFSDTETGNCWQACGVRTPTRLTLNCRCALPFRRVNASVAGGAPFAALSSLPPPGSCLPFLEDAGIVSRHEGSRCRHGRCDVAPLLADLAGPEGCPDALHQPARPCPSPAHGSCRSTTAPDHAQP